MCIPRGVVLIADGIRAEAGFHGATDSVDVNSVFEIGPIAGLVMGLPKSVLLLGSINLDFIALIACSLHLWNTRSTLSESLFQPTAST